MNSKNREHGHNLVLFLPVGAGIGAAIGSATGTMAVWVGIGAGVDIALATVLPHTATEDDAP